MIFDKMFERLLGNEGALSLDPKDRGNWTTGVIGKGELRGSMYGISAMSYPNLDIKNLTPEQCKVIYKRDFWDVVKGDLLAPSVAFQLFDFCVNSGPSNAVKGFQRALGTSADGQIGAQTLEASKSMSETDQVMRIVAERIRFMVKCPGWSTQGAGWMNRMAANLYFGAADS